MKDFGYTSERVVNWIAVGLLLLLFFQLLTSAVVKSPTFDEVLHATRGYVFLATGDWRMQMNLHPPLIHLITGILMRPVFPSIDPQQSEAWITTPLLHFDLAKDVVAAMGYPSGFVPVFFGRVVVIGFTLVLGALLFQWAKSWYGSGGGLLALGIYTFAPNVLAHGRLITTDMPVVMTFFLAVYALQRLVYRPTYKSLLFAGFSLGLALGAKISAVVLIPLFAIMIMPWIDKPDWLRNPGYELRRDLLHLPQIWLLGTVVIALVVLWAIYGFEVGPYDEGWPALPLPTYVNTLASSFFSFYRNDIAPPAFLMGRYSLSGWWYYFLVTFFVKTPLPMIISGLVGLGWLFYKRFWWQVWFGAIWPIVYFGMAILNSWNLGYRYILPIEPFLILWMTSAYCVFQRYRILQILGVILLAWLVVGTVSIYPNYLAYFNEVIGGPENGYRFLTDSNLDWGQDLIQLREYLKEAGIQELYFSYFGSMDPESYGIEYVALPHSRFAEVEAPFAMYAPPPGMYAISVTNLSGQSLSNSSTYD
ncbi:MAG TPA: hypothetical protein ENN32_09115 [Chloroflexi bacterium]|nr:hypothetical protein [Chloroflexota bacterium]